MTCSGNDSWLLEHIVIPAFFLILGATLGFLAGQVKDYFDSRRTKKAFLRAIRVELSTLQSHLEGTLHDVTDVRESLMQKGERKALHLPTAFQVGVYTSQLGKLRDVSDALVLEVIRFYDQLSNLERVKSHVSVRSFDLTTLTNSDADIKRENPVACDYVSSLDEVLRRVKQLISAASILIGKLPE